MAITPTSISVLAAAHEEWISDQKADSFFDATDVTKLFYKSNAKYSAGGGIKVVWSAEVAQATTAAGIAAGATVAATNAEFMKRAELDWTFIATLTNKAKVHFDVYNAGDASQVNLYKAWMDNIKQSVMEEIGQQPWSNIASAVNVNDFVPFVEAIDDTITYAGLVTATYTKWKSYKKDMGAATSIDIATVVEAINDIRFRRKGKADLIVCGFEDYLALEAEGLGAVRHPMVKAGATTELGLETFTIHGARVVVDRFLDAEPANGLFASPDPRGVAGSNKVYILSTDQIGYIPMPKERLVGYKTIDSMFQVSNLVDLFPITGATVYQVGMESGGVLFVPNRRPHGVIIHS